MKTLLPLIILTLAGIAIAQSDLPEIGKITDLKGKTKVYIVSNADARPFLLKEIAKNKTLAVVDKPADAEFFLEYKILDQYRVTDLDIPVTNGQLDAYFYRDKTKVIAWSKSKNGGAFRTVNAASLVRTFLKDLE